MLLQGPFHSFVILSSSEQLQAAVLSHLDHISLMSLTQCHTLRSVQLLGAPTQGCFCRESISAQ